LYHSSPTHDPASAAAAPWSAAVAATHDTSSTTAALWGAAVDTSARAMEELRSESDGQSEASVAPSDQSVGYGTSGDDFDEEQVAGCESCGESDSEDVSSEVDEDAATDADAAPEDIPACSM